MVATKPTMPAPETNRRRWYVQAGVGLALFGLAAAWFFMRPNPQVAKVRELQKDLVAAAKEKLSPEERKEKFETLRAEKEKLSPEERKEVGKELGQQFQQKMAADALAYVKMTPAERVKAIDQKIAREQAMMQKKGAGGGWKGPGSGPPGGAPAGTNTAANPGGGAQGAGGGPGGAVGGGPFGKGPSTPEERDTRRRESLIHVSAEARAAMDQIRLDTAVRRAQLGLPPATQGRGPGPR